MASEEKTIEEILRLVSTRMDLQTEQVKELTSKLEIALEKLEEEKKEFRASRELLDDLISEYDRLTERVSTQIAAMIRWFDELKEKGA